MDICCLFFRAGTGFQRFQDRLRQLLRELHGKNAFYTARLDAADEEVWALRMTIALTQNNTNAVTGLLESANTEQLSTAAALVALSYAQQKQLQLLAALETVNRAVAGPVLRSST